MIDALLSTLGLKKGALLGGVLGALISLKFIDGLNAYQRGTTVIAGAFAAAYSSPIVLETMDLKPTLEGGVAFLIGLFGMSLAGAIIKAMPGLVAAAKARISGK